MKVNVEILMGLPGSGKTYYANTKKQQSLEKSSYRNEEVLVVNFDQKMWYQPQWFSISRDLLILDGLFLTTDAVIEVLKELRKRCPRQITPVITIVRWKENREVCLHNDYNRRTENSKLTIKKAKFEYPDLDRIKKETGYTVTVTEKKVIKKPSAYNNLPKESESCIQGDYLVSKSWVLGGSQRSYDDKWDSVYSPIFSDEVPEFNELYDFLEKICPTLSFLDGRKIMKDFVHIREYEESDYYSCTQNAQYVCNLKKLMDYLEEKNYI